MDQDVQIAKLNQEVDQKNTTIDVLYPILFSYWVYHNEKLFIYEYNHEKVYFTFNILFGILNFYWGYKLIKKAIKYKNKTIKQK